MRQVGGPRGHFYVSFMSGYAEPKVGDVVKMTTTNYQVTKITAITDKPVGYITQIEANGILQVEAFGTKIIEVPFEGVLVPGNEIEPAVSGVAVQAFTTGKVIGNQVLKVDNTYGIAEILI